MLRITHFVFVLIFAAAISYGGQESSKISPVLQEKLGLQSYKGFLLQENDDESWDSNYAIVSSFQEGAIESQVLFGARNLEAAKAIIDQNLVPHNYKNIDVRELTLPRPDGQKMSLFWAGDRAYDSLEAAQGGIDQALTSGIPAQALETKAEERVPAEAVEVSVTEAEVVPSEEGTGAHEEKSHYPFAIDQKIQRVQIPGTKIEPEENRFDWQTFGEFSWRRTNFSSPNSATDHNYFNNVVGFHALRVMMKGIHFYDGGPSIDPYIEGIVSLGTNANAFENKFVAVAGLEYRPLDGWGLIKGKPWVDWLQSIRLFGQYMDLYHLRNTDTAATTYDWRAGMGLYKDWGWAEPFDEEARTHISDYIWGELFMENAWKKTDFNSPEFESFTWTNAGWIGLKFPWVGDIPPLMPYLKMEISANQHDAFFQNKLILGGGVRYMPFHTSRFKGSEWLYNFKIFAEYDNIAIYFKDDPTEDQPDWDFRAGIKIDINRF